MSSLASRLTGLLAFPVTPFDPQGEIDVPRFVRHLEFLLAHRPAALFVCAGTGEFFSLTFDEYRALVKAAVETAAGRVPVIAGTGYGTRPAIAYAQAAQAAGADGVLVLPPYLVGAEQEGLLAHYRAIAAAVSIAVIPYMRDNAIFTPETVAQLAESPNVAAFKDGHGNLELLNRIRLATAGRLLLINGMPTAEMSAPAFFAIGARTYSSAIFNFMPAVSARFYRALVRGEQETVEAMLEQVIRPICALRDRRRGYAVSLIKAGVGLIGEPVGGVRPPLTDPTPEERAMLRDIIERALARWG
ncbi:MAG TPA: 5-dehydro-4-deoxyglucarate dehydratase [Limnochordia bacterium]